MPLQQPPRGGAHRRVVVHQQHLARGGVWHDRVVCAGPQRALGGRPGDAHGRSKSGRRHDVDVATGLRHRAVHHRQPQSGAAPGGFGGEERLEDARACGLVHAGARIGHGEHRLGPFGIDGDRDPEGTPVGQRVAGIEHEVEDHLLYLAPIGEHAGVGHVCLQIESDGRRDRRPDQRHHVPHERRQIDHFAHAGLLAAEREELPGEAGSPIGGVQGDLEVGAGCRVGRQAVGRQLHGVAHRSQQVVEVVGNAARQLPDGFHLLNDIEPFLQFGALPFEFEAPGLVAPRHHRDTPPLHGRMADAHLDWHRRAIGTLVHPVEHVRPLRQGLDAEGTGLGVGQPAVRLGRRRKLGGPVPDQL